MARWEGAPFAYLNGMTPADDAPVMDNPAQSYCPGCRADGRMVCGDPGHCGNLRPMKPLPASEMIIDVKATPHTPRPGSAELKGQKPVRLDDSAPNYTPPPRQDAQSRPRPPVGRQEGAGHAFDRLMGRRTTITQAGTGPVIDGEEKSWEWFMENVTADIAKLEGKD